MKLGLVALPFMDVQPDGTMRSIGMDMCRECPPLSIYGLAAIGVSENHEVVVKDLVAEGRLLNWNDLGELAQCDLVGLTATSLNWPTVLDAIRKLRASLPDVPLVIGGPHATLFDSYLIEHYQVDYVVRGEGEYALAMLCRHIEGLAEKPAVPNLTWKTSAGTAHRNPQYSGMTPAELERCPFPLYERMPSSVYQGLSLESSRGCPFDCSFCSTSYRKSYRALCPECFVAAVAEAAVHVDRTRLKIVHIVDDEFFLNWKRAVRIAELLDELGTSFRFSYDARANDLLREELVAEWCRHTYEFLVGAECGYDEGLRRIGKGTTPEMLERAAAMLTKYGYAESASFSFIIGLPWESLEEVKKTVAFATRLSGEYGIKIILQWYCQIPGSQLWSEARRQGRVSEAIYDDFGFFRNEHLFFSGVRLRPDEIWELSDIISLAKWTLKLKHARQDPVEYSVPQVVAHSFPRDVSTTESFNDLVRAVAASQ